MHLRRRGNNVQIVKTRPGEGGKATSMPVGSANLATGVIRTREEGVLTAEETAEVKAWIARHKAIEMQKQEVDYRLFAETLAGMAGWIRGADPKLLAEHSDEVRAGLQQVRRALDQAMGAEPRTGARGAKIETSAAAR